MEHGESVDSRNIESFPVAKDETSSDDITDYNGHSTVDLLYSDYLSAKDLLKHNTETHAKLHEFKFMQREQNLAGISGKTITFDERKCLSNIYSELVNNPIASDFLIKERKLMNAIAKIISQFDIDYL